MLGRVTNGVALHLLNGNIASTNTFGNLQVNAVMRTSHHQQQRGPQSRQSSINAGQAVPGVVQVVDRGGGGYTQNAYQTKTTWYVYTPGAAAPLSIYTAPGSSPNDYNLATKIGSYNTSSELCADRECDIDDN